MEASGKPSVAQKRPYKADDLTATFGAVFVDVDAQFMHQHVRLHIVLYVYPLLYLLKKSKQVRRWPEISRVFTLK